MTSSRRIQTAPEARGSQRPPRIRPRADNQLDAYASGNYAKAADTYRAAYAHMFMTGDLLSRAIAKQKSLK